MWRIDFVEEYKGFKLYCTIQNKLIEYRKNYDEQNFISVLLTEINDEYVFSARKFTNGEFDPKSVYYAYETTNTIEETYEKMMSWIKTNSLRLIVNL